LKITIICRSGASHGIFGLSCCRLRIKEVGMSKKLLLADDSITIQKVIQITFAHEDYELTITDNGDTALTKALEIMPDLVMADVYMPGKNGYELATAIKRDPSLQHVPVLLLAGSFEPFDEEKARSCQADAWIEKPFESQTLIDKVAELLSAAPSSPRTEVPDVEPATADPALTAYDEPVDEGPEISAASEDPFGDISFGESSPAEEAEPVASVEDWSDVVLESVEEPGEADAESLSAGIEADVIEDSRADQEDLPTAAGPVSSDFEAGVDVFDMEEEIMPLEDEDILGAEDLEPIMEEQTLASWSRADADEDLFAEPLEAAQPDTEMTFVEESRESAAFVEEPAAFVEEPVAFDEEPAAFVEEPAAFVEEPVAFDEEPVAFDEEPAAFVEEPVAFDEEPAAFNEEPAAIAEGLPPVAETSVALDDAETRAAAMSEQEIEQIVEKVVKNVVEKLAGSILEKVAWEVVPDLAESLIREEIRKIKDAAA
jgi:CheY-like chemotaxis protein